MKKWLICLLFIPCYANAWWWQDLWQTKDQQGRVLLSKGNPKKASTTFKRKDWQSVAHYRAGQYKQAAKLLASLTPSMTRYYNEGNALAHTGQYEKAISAYNNALKINPKDLDTLFNKQLVENLLKKQQQEQQKQQEEEQQKNNMNNQEQQKQQGGQDQQQPQQSPEPKQENSPSEGDKNKQKDQKNQKDQKDQNNNKDESQDKKQNSQQANQQNKSKAPKLSANETEQQQAQMQRLKRIPDDPGGLLRQKFIRDYIRRHPERW